MAKILVLALFFLGTRPEVETGKLVVIVKGVQLESGGELSTGIFTQENFPKVGKHSLVIVSPVEANQMQVVFEKVPVGEYGIASFQDIDKDKKLKSNIVGYPTEPIGFSRDAKMRFGPPAFEDAKVTIKPNTTLTITITLK